MALLTGTEHGVAAGVMVGVVWLGRRLLGQPGGTARWAATAGLVAAGTAGGLLTLIGGPAGAVAALRYAFAEVPHDQFWYFGAPPNHFHHTWAGLLTDRALLLRAAGPVLAVAGVAVVRLRSDPAAVAVLGLMACAAVAGGAYLGIRSPHYLDPLTRATLIGAMVLGWRAAADSAGARRAAGWVAGVAAGVLLPTGASTAGRSSLFDAAAVARDLGARAGVVRRGECRMTPELDAELARQIAAVDADRAARGVTRPPVLWSVYAGRLLEAPTTASSTRPGDVDQSAAAERVRKREALVEVDHEVAGRPDAFACGAAVGLHLSNTLSSVVAAGALREACRIEAEETPPRLHAGSGAFAQGVAAASERGGVTLQMVAIHPAQELVDRHAERLAFEIPQRQVQCTDRVEAFAPGWIVEGAIHVLPQALDVKRVLPDEPTGTGLDGVSRTSFTNAGDIGVRFNRDDHVALQKRNLQRHHRRRLVEPNARDLRLRQRGLRVERPEQRGRRSRGCRLEEGAAIHPFAPGCCFPIRTAPTCVRRAGRCREVR